jgi:hypothetical protein
MRFGRKMNNGIDVVFKQQTVHQRPVADVALDEDVPVGIGQIAQVFQAARIGERVQVEDAHFGSLGQRPVDEIRTNKPGAAGHQQILHVFLP